MTVSTPPTLTLNANIYSRSSRDRLAEARDRSVDGARAALESFYCAFNNADLDLLSAIWIDDPLAQLNNPLGGMLRGIGPIRELYAGVFDGPGTAWVRFEDVLELTAADTVVFAGRERGEFSRPGIEPIDLDIRTTRFFAYVEGTGWRQAHHHGSIDNGGLLQRYQQAARGPDSGVAPAAA